MSDGFDLHGNRHRLKQLSDDGDTALFENRDAAECPACGASFGRLFVTRKATTTFPENDGSRFCLVRDASDIYVFRH